MKIDIEIEGCDRGSELRQLAHCCAGYELGTFRKQIASVRIHLASAQRSLNGRLRNCKVEVIFHDRGGIFAEAADASPYVAIHWALERAGWTIAKRQKGRSLDQPIANTLPIREPSPANHGAPGMAA